MPRLRLAARFLRARTPSSSAVYWPSCTAAATAATGLSFSSSSSPTFLDPYLSSSLWKSISSSASPGRQKEEDNKRVPGRFWISLIAGPSSSSFLNPSLSSSLLKSSSSSASPGRLKEEDDKRVSSRFWVSPIADPAHDLVNGVKIQQQQVWLLGQRLPPPRQCLSLSAVYSTDATNFSECDRHDDEEQRPQGENLAKLGGSDLVSPSAEKIEVEEVKEETDAVDREGFYSRHDNSPAALDGNNGLSTSLLHDEGEEEVITELDSSSLTSTEEDEFAHVEVGLLDSEEVPSQSEDLDDDAQFEVGHCRPEEGKVENIRWTASTLEHMPHEDSAEREEMAASELFTDLDVVSTTAEDARELGFIESAEPHRDHGDHDGLPYLHTLSVDEIREILEKARAKDVRILEVRKCCEWVDQLVFASGRSSRHLRGMADAIVYKVKQRSENVGPNSFPIVEGRDGEQWMAIDCGNIVVHLFLEEARSYYNLEEFWTKKSNPRLVETF